MSERARVYVWKGKEKKKKKKKKRGGGGGQSNLGSNLATHHVSRIVVKCDTCEVVEKGII